jgi:hypothetical protein
MLLTDTENIVNLWRIYCKVIKCIYHPLSLYVYMSILYISVCDNIIYMVHSLSSVTMQLHLCVCYSDNLTRNIEGSCKGCITSVSILEI